MCLHLFKGAVVGGSFSHADASSGCRKAVSYHGGVPVNFVGRFERPQAEEASLSFCSIRV